NLTNLYGYWREDLTCVNEPQSDFEDSASQRQFTLIKNTYTSEKVDYSQQVSQAVTDLEDIKESRLTDIKRNTSQDEYNIRIESEIKRIQQDFDSLQGLMREYYLDMELASNEDPSHDPWYK
ncbi:hypothetical protein BGZ76_005123, partial [Entomortierella beljakovae]